MEQNIVMYLDDVNTDNCVFYLNVINVHIHSVYNIIWETMKNISYCTQKMKITSKHLINMINETLFPKS